MALTQWERFAEEQFESLATTKPSKEGLLLMSSCLTVMGFKEIMEFKKMYEGRDSTRDRYSDMRRDRRY